MGMIAGVRSRIASDISLRWLFRQLMRKHVAQAAHPLPHLRIPLRKRRDSLRVSRVERLVASEIETTFDVSSRSVASNALGPSSRRITASTVENRPKASEAHSLVAVRASNPALFSATVLCVGGESLHTRHPLLYGRLRTRSESRADEASESANEDSVNLIPVTTWGWPILRKNVRKLMLKPDEFMELLREC